MADLDSHVAFSARTLVQEHVTLHVTLTGTRLMRVRMLCAIPFAWLAAKVAGTGFKIDSE